MRDRPRPATTVASPERHSERAAAPPGGLAWPEQGTRLDQAVPAEQAAAAPGRRPANRAERRAAARGRAADHQEGPTAPTRSGPQARTRPAHVRADYVPRRGG